MRGYQKGISRWSDGEEEGQEWWVKTIRSFIF